MNKGIWGIPVSVQEVRTNPFNNDKSASDTIHKMIEVAHRGAASIPIKSIVNECLIRARYHQKVKLRELIRNIYWWVKSHVKFEEDENILKQAYGVSDGQIASVGGIDMIISPEVLVRMPQPMGDCDCFSTLLASILVCAHIPCYFVTIAADANESDRWSHVYVMAHISDEGEDIYLDASHGSYPGWETSTPMFRKLIWRVN